MNDDQRHAYNAAKAELDYWRERDNYVLFTLGNPPELDSSRQSFLRNMRRCMGEMQRIKKLAEGG